MSEEDAALAFVREHTGATRVRSGERIQSLWSGYGEILRVELEGAARETAILKWVKPPRSAKGDDVSHARKTRSYDVETAFYRRFADRCTGACRVASLLGARASGGEWLLLFEDLDASGFPARDSDPRGSRLDACLSWLASFHARFFSTRPDGLWKIGTYWHLDTRREELANIRDAALRARAPELDRALREARFQTLVHGDAKPDNFCFARDGARVAAVDFQYVGGGPGIRDVAYLLHGSRGAARSLDFYFERLRSELAPEIDGAEVEREWRALHPLATEDFQRFLVGWRR